MDLRFTESILCVFASLILLGIRVEGLPLNIDVVVSNGQHSAKEHQSPQSGAPAHLASGETHISPAVKELSFVLPGLPVTPLAQAAPRPLPLKSDRSDSVVPIEVIVNDDFSKWQGSAAKIDPNLNKQAASATSYPIWRLKQMFNRSTSHVEVTVPPGYGLDILDDKLPRDLVGCYDNMTNKVLESLIYSPAAYGERLCGNLERSESCVERKHDERGLTFLKEMRSLRGTICDPDCPFAQVKSCETRIVNATGTPSQTCGIEPVLSCIDAMLAQLKCGPHSRALVYWLRSRILARLTHCDRQHGDCVKQVERCLQPLSQYITHQRPQTLCRRKEKMIACVSAATRCEKKQRSNIMTILRTGMGRKFC